MRIRTLEISVGALILAGLLALVVLAINVSGLNVADQGQGYKVVARFDNIGGLTERAKGLSIWRTDWSGFGYTNR